MGFVHCDTFTGLYCFYKNGTRTPGNHLRETWWCSSWHCCDLRAGQAQSDEADQRLETRCHSWRLNVAPQWDVETWFSDLDSSWNIIGNGPQNLVWTPTIYPRDKSTHPACAKHLRHRQHVLAFRYLTWDGRSQTCKSSSRCFGSILGLVFYSWDCHSLCRQIQVYP